MSKLQILNVNSKTIYQIIRDSIYLCVTTPIIVEDKKFHHQLRIENVPNAIEYGLLSNALKVKLIEKRELTDKERFIYSDDCHVNGFDSISLSSVEEDLSKMYADEDLWSTYSGSFPDIVVSKKVDAKKITINYFNEYLVLNQIPADLFNSIDLRIFKLMNQKFESEEEKIKEILKYYEYIRKIAISLKNKELSIPLRETSEVTNKDEYDKAITLDLEKVIELPKLVLKKNSI